MKMSNNPVICNQCLEKIGKVSSKAATIWSYLCDDTNEYLNSIKSNENQERLPVIRLTLYDQPIFEILENLNFITTHETNENTYVKVLYLRQENGEILFCDGNCE